MSYRLLFGIGKIICHENTKIIIIIAKITTHKNIQTKIDTGVVLRKKKIVICLLNLSNDYSI